LKKAKAIDLILIGVLLSLFSFYILSYGWLVSLQQIINGLQKGSMYALIALGYTLVYGIIKLINFAHGDVFMVGVYFSYFAGNFFLGRGGGQYAFWLAIAAAVLVCLLLNMIIEIIAYRPLRDKPRLTMLITSIGVSLFLENFLALDPNQVPFPLKYFVFGPQFRSFPTLIQEKVISLGKGLIISNIKIINLAIALLLMILLEYIVKRTRMGKAMRAVSFNMDVAKLMGININHVIAFTFALGGALAGCAGMLFGITYGVLQSPYLGLWPGIVAFVAAVIGGIGNIPGAMLGGFLMGIIETLALSINSNLGYGVTFLILILVLLMKPTGLLGSPHTEKI
jgi:branched-chain amino acid transport system permease protein